MNAVESRRQMGLFDPRPPAQAHSKTSKAAAESMEPKLGTLRAVVLTYVRMAGDRGVTDEEIQQGLGMNPNTERPRRIELAKAGFIYDTKTTRTTESGRDAVVWKAASV